VLPLGAPPPIWEIVKVNERIYLIRFGARLAASVNGTLRLNPPGFPPFEWLLLQGAPSPPPVGRDSFGIIAPNQQPQQSWFIPSTEGDQAIEVPVRIGSSASSVVIRPAQG